jgi:hypothetical protein
MVMVSRVQWNSARLKHGLTCGSDPLHSMPGAAIPLLHREAGDPSKAKPYLPDPQKQYLITRNGARQLPISMRWSYCAHVR